LSQPPDLPRFPYTTLFRSIGDQVEGAAADHDARAVGPVQLGEELLLVRGILVEDVDILAQQVAGVEMRQVLTDVVLRIPQHLLDAAVQVDDGVARSEEHTSELQSRENLVCRLLLEKK